MEMPKIRVAQSSNRQMFRMRRGNNIYTVHSRTGESLTPSLQIYSIILGELRILLHFFGTLAKHWGGP